MENDQRSKLDSYQRVQAFNAAYATDLAAISDYTGLQNEFNNLVNEIITKSAEQQGTAGITADLLSETKLNMAETAIQFASRGVVKAQLAGNNELANQLDEPVSFIYRAEKNISVQRATILRNLMNDNLAVLTNISPGDITAIDEAIAAYANIMNKPVTDIQHRKSQGTDALPALFKKADGLLDNMFRLVKSYFFRSNAAMMNEMALAMQLIHTGIRHTLVNITVLAAEDDAPLLNVVVEDNSNGRAYTSDFNGIVHIDTHKSGHDTFTISAAGRQDVTIGMDIKRATDNRLTVKLVRV
jgi:hypothetical protein